MIRTGDEYRASIRDGRNVWINGEKVEDPVAMHDKLGDREFSILQDYMNMWTRSIGELL